MAKAEVCPANAGGAVDSGRRLVDAACASGVVRAARDARVPADLALASLSISAILSRARLRRSAPGAPAAGAAAGPAMTRLLSGGCRAFCVAVRNSGEVDKREASNVSDNRRRELVPCSDHKRLLLALFFQTCQLW